MKSNRAYREANINSPYDFMRCRCDIDANGIMNERFLAKPNDRSLGNMRIWILSPIERRVALKMLTLINDYLQAEDVRIRVSLRGATDFGFEYPHSGV